MLRFASIATVLAAALAPPAWADDWGGSTPSEVEQHFGFAPGEEERAFDPRTRDANGNRLILDGVIQNQGGSTLVGGLQDGTSFGSSLGQNGSTLGQATAVGNQLNVITTGSFNTVIVNSTQTNNGDVKAVAQGE